MVKAEQECRIMASVPLNRNFLHWHICLTSGRWKVVIMIEHIFLSQIPLHRCFARWSKAGILFLLFGEILLQVDGFAACLWMVTLTIHNLFVKQAATRHSHQCCNYATWYSTTKLGAGTEAPDTFYWGTYDCYVTIFIAPRFDKRAVSCVHW